MNLSRALVRAFCVLPLVMVLVFVLTVLGGAAIGSALLGFGAALLGLGCVWLGLGAAWLGMSGAWLGRTCGSVLLPAIA